MKYLVTKEIKSETQVVWKLYFQDFAFLVIWIAVNLYIKNWIHTYMQIPFCIFAIAVGVVLVLPTATNPKRRQYQGIALFLMRKRGTLYYLKEEQHERQKEHPKYQRRSSGITLR